MIFGGGGWPQGGSFEDLAAVWCHTVRIVADNCINTNGSLKLLIITSCDIKKPPVTVQFYVCSSSSRIQAHR